MAQSKELDEIVSKAALKAAGLGIPGSFLPPLDIAGMSYIWFKLIRDLSKASGHKVNFIYASKFTLSVTSAASLYIGGTKLINMMLHAIPGAGNVTAATSNAIFNWIYTLRLGKLLSRQFSQPNFDTNTLLISASGIAGLVFAFPTPDEMTDAFHTLGDMLGIVGDPHTVADIVTSDPGHLADLAAGGNLGDGSSHLMSAHTDVHFGEQAGQHVAVSEPRFGNADVHDTTAYAMSGLQDILHAPPDVQQEHLEALFHAAQSENESELAHHIMEFKGGKGSLNDLLAEAHQKLRPSVLHRVAQVRFGGRN